MTGFVIFVVVMIVVSLINKARQGSKSGTGQPNARMQAMIERIQAQQGGNQPVQFQGQFTQAAGPGGPPPSPTPSQPTFPVQTGTAQGSQQAAAVLQQLLQNGRQPRHAGERNSPGQAAQQPGHGTPYPQTGMYQPPAQFQPSQYPVQYNPGPYQPPAHRPQQNNLPAPNQDLDARVRALMNAKNEVGAIRLLSDEREMGILEAQKYARTLVAPPAAQQDADVLDEPDEERYVGSAAFAESIFNVNDRDENVWASGWVDEPEPEDRSDIEELWQTVSNPPRATPPTSQ
ncbi:hypothetical protein EV649_7580 [Kribbella sp. VKM Ac-2569]|uniref:hypothetical protein n=1 Tax=Kribbella sp. VKM Ac-2569 TaxID=2512220 RepID=UPI00102C3CBD|nr:hypothetical protein [Kribbella sp. VKM Ac-2569]RZT11924.1 hypothetical protein EV649_7580 [Kribbella sp. VKM Ac-2569]